VRRSNSILGYSQVLMRDPAIAGALRDSVGTIHRSGQHLVSLVDGLLELSRIEAGKLRLEKEPVDLADFLAQIVRMFEPMAREKSLEFRYVVEGRLPERVHADPKRLRQILINLLGNAIKFTERGFVSLHVRYLRDLAHIEVVDSGIGIDTVDQARIFLPFERAAGRGGVEGLGLGLTITQLLVDLMGGDVRLTSRIGEGSRFKVRLYLPAIRVQAPRSLLEEPTGYAGKRCRVLVVDDEAPHRAVLREMLLPLGFHVSESESAAKCLEITARERFDVVLLDVNLPDRRGWDVCEALQARPRPQPKVVMVSGNVGENTDLRRARHRYAGFVAKPVMRDDLLATLAAALELRWIRAAPASGPASGSMAASSSPARDDAVPDAETLRELLALSAGGYPNALRARLSEIARESPAQGMWVARMSASLDENKERFHARLLDAIRERAAA
jgi:CheY-like chemotaxis protein